MIRSNVRSNEHHDNIFILDNIVRISVVSTILKYISNIIQNVIHSTMISNEIYDNILK